MIFMFKTQGKVLRKMHRDVWNRCMISVLILFLFSGLISGILKNSEHNAMFLLLEEFALFLVTLIVLKVVFVKTKRVNKEKHPSYFALAEYGKKAILAIFCLFPGILILLLLYNRFSAESGALCTISLIGGIVAFLFYSQRWELDRLHLKPGSYDAIQRKIFILKLSFFVPLLSCLLLFPALYIIPLYQESLNSFFEYLKKFEIESGPEYKIKTISVPNKLNSC